MKKATAITLAGGSGQKLASILGMSRQSVSNMPDELDRKWTDRIVGALIRNKKITYDGAMSLFTNG